MPLTKFGAWTAESAAEVTKSDPWQGVFTPTAGDLTPPTGAPAMYLLQKASAAAVTLGAPISGTDDYKCIGFLSGSAAAHVITATGLLQTGSTNSNTATFAAFAGANVVFMAYQGKWIVVGSTGTTFA